MTQMNFDEKQIKVSKVKLILIEFQLRKFSRSLCKCLKIEKKIMDENRITTNILNTNNSITGLNIRKICQKCEIPKFHRRFT